MSKLDEFAGYDNWKTAGCDEGLGTPDLAAPCAFEQRKARCGIAYEDHNDEELGHFYVAPERPERETR